MIDLYVYLGVGKGTFAKLISAVGINSYRKLVHLSLGDILRSYKNVETRNSLLVTEDLENIRNCLSSGRLVDDKLANNIIRTQIRKFSGINTCFILDGYPRTISQAASLLEMFSVPQHSVIPLAVIDIQLERNVAIEKLLGRRLCSTCGLSFNFSHIVTETYDMPAMLPDIEECSKQRGVACEMNLVKRDDDTRETIEFRYKEYEKEILPVLTYFHNLDLLHTFTVERGIADSDKLRELMSEISSKWS